LRFGKYFFRLDDFIHGGQMCRHAYLVFFAGLAGRSNSASKMPGLALEAGPFLRRHPPTAAA